MNFQQSDYIQMGITCAVTACICALIFIKWPICPECPPCDQYVPQPLDKYRISWNTAERIMDDYEVNKKIMIEYPDGSGGKTEKMLHGFTIEAAQIDEIMNHNLNGRGGNPKADRLLILFGEDGTATGGIPNLTLITAGMQGAEILRNVEEPNNDIRSSVFDRADPCPPNTLSIPGPAAVPAGE